jgi:hypothetical protein
LRSGQYCPHWDDIHNLHDEHALEAQVEKENFHQFNFSFSQGEGNGRFSQMVLCVRRTWPDVGRFHGFRTRYSAGAEFYSV